MPERFDLKPDEYLHDPTRKKYLNERMFSVIAPRYDFVTRALSFSRDTGWKPVRSVAS